MDEWKLAQARSKETLTAVAGVVLSGLRILGNGIIRKLSYTDSLKFEPTPAVLKNTENRADRIYVMLDNCKGLIQEGKRGRGAKKRKKHKGFEEKFNVEVTGKRRPGYEQQESKGKKANTR